MTVTGFGFGATAGRLTLGSHHRDGHELDGHEDRLHRAEHHAFGPAALRITNSAGLSSYNGLTVQVLDALTATTPGRQHGQPALAEVGPGKQFHTVQAALEAARPTSAKRYWLVVVWPNAATADNPHGQYNENLIVHHQVRIQGVGPGGFDAQRDVRARLDPRRCGVQPRQRRRGQLDLAARLAALLR